MAKEVEKNAGADEPKAEPKTTAKVKDEAAEPSHLEPYPTGNPPDPEDQFAAAHGFRRAKE